MAKKRYHGADSAMANYKSAKSLEKNEGSMINEDMSAPALLPRNVIDKYWEETPSYMQHIELDLFRGVEKQMKKDRSDFSREFFPHKQ